MVRRTFLAIAAVAASVAALAFTYPVTREARSAWAWLEAQDDPHALAALQLAAPDIPDRWRDAFTQALDAEDIDLARSLLDLAAAQSMAVPPDLRARYEAALSPAAVARRGARQFYAGATSGEGDTAAGLAGALAADLSGVGDLRDLAREGNKVARGEDADELVLGLAVVGVLATGATIASFGMAAPARGGVTTLKAAARAGQISAPLRRRLAVLSRDLVDRDKVATAARSAAALDPAAARTALAAAIRPAALRQLRESAGDLVLIGNKAGTRAARQALVLAQEPGDLRRVARLAEARGTATPAILRLLGRGAIVLTASVLTLANWVMAGLLWVAGAFMLCAILARRFGAMLARWTRVRPAARSPSS